MADSIAAKALRTIILVGVFAVFMIAYFRATIPGYFESVKLCYSGCHATRVLDPVNITYPFWCVGCHGFGVKSEILPGIPFYRDHKLELLVEEHGECLMCHRVPGEFHWKHLEAKPEELAKYGLPGPIKCTACHVNAYHGHHTDLPRDKVCIKCHDAAKIHGEMVSSLRAACTACHSDQPLVPADYMKPNATSYQGAIEAVSMLAVKLGIRYLPSDPCKACHRLPENPGHESHYGKLYQGHAIQCIDCHLGQMPHGWKPGLDECRTCHPYNKTKLHDYPRLLADCYRCHRGFREANTTLVPRGTCTACHADSLARITRIGLHASHVVAYKGNCGVCHNIKAKSHEEFIESAKKLELCKKCHDEYGGLKSEALTGLSLLSALRAGAGLTHALFVEKASGNCFECHYEWHVPLKPSLVYLYPPAGGGER